VSFRGSNKLALYVHSFCNEKQQMVKNPSLRRSLSLFEGVALVLGTVIGSGIFASPGKVLDAAGSVGLSLIVWIVGGLLSLAGALCYAELGTALPLAGGEYAYLSKSLGRPCSFVFTWTQFFVMKTTTQAIISIIFANYLGRVLFGPSMEENDWRLKVIAISAIVLITTINCISIRWGSLVQVSCTVLKIAALIGITILGLASLVGFTSVDSSGSFVAPFTSLKPDLVGSNIINGFGLSMISALWAYEGWNHLNYVSEELKNPERDLPRAIVVGLVGVIIIYIFVNVAYLAVLSPQEVIASQAVATDFAVKVIGRDLGLILIPLAVAISTFGATNGFMLTSSRIFYAAARDGQFPSFLNQINPTTGVPTRALITQGVWACILLALPATGFSTLLSFYGFAAWVFYGLAAISVIILRWKYPDLERPYKVWLYPYVPIIFFAVSCFLILNSIITTPSQSFYSLISILSGIPVYYLFFRRDSRNFKPLP
jgi:L-type amino acid transporter 9